MTRRYVLTIETEEELHRITFASMFPDALGINLDHDGAVTRQDYVIGRWTWAEAVVQTEVETACAAEQCERTEKP